MGEKYHCRPSDYYNETDIKNIQIDWICYKRVIKEYNKQAKRAQIEAEIKRKRKRYGR